MKLNLKTETENVLEKKEKEIKKLENNRINKRSEKLLSGYFVSDKQGKERFVSYASLMTLTKNPTARHNLTSDLEDAYHLSFNKDDEKSYLYNYNTERYVEINRRTLQAFLIENEEIRLDTTDTENILKSNVKRIRNRYDYIEFNNKLFNLKTYDIEDKAQKKVIANVKYETTKPQLFITPKRINYDILLKRNEDFDPDNNIVYETLKQILGSENNIKDFKQRLGLSIFNTGKEITIYYAPSGNNGKSILLYIRRLVLCEVANLIRLNQLTDDFNHEIVNHIHELQIDEPEPQNFQKTEAPIKKVTGGGMEETTRKMHSQDKQKSKINSHLVIATNTLPDFNLNDTAIFNRISIIELKNKFSYSYSEVNDINVFPINDNIQDELKKD
jgi:phage/plasmid-associated DNA primase